MDAENTLVCTTEHELMCPSSWKLYIDNFPFFSSSLACLEPELELFEVDAIGDDDDLSHVYHI